jgi:mannose-6-phosphate isomerase-like protein (cupin superfamily)
LEHAAEGANESETGEHRMSAFFNRLSDVDRWRVDSGKSYQEFLRMPSMSIGLYVLPVNGLDLQKPHNEDEAYYLIRGRAHFRSGNDDREVSAGTAIFVEKGIEHCFHDITEKLEALVFFAPPET